MPSEGVKDTLDYYWKSEYGFSKKLQKYVLEWLMTIDTTSAECKKESLRNAQDAIVINFNYTDTVERIYGIKNVLHIHGGIPSCCSIPPIMGHGNKSIIESHRRKAAECQREFIEWGESINEAIANYCESLYKNTERIILSNEAFFSSIGDVDEIICLGLSFGDVDTPYLERILQEIKPTVKWTVYYHKPESRDRLKQIFDMLGICKSYKVNFLPSNDFWDR